MNRADDDLNMAGPKFADRFPKNEEDFDPTDANAAAGWYEQRNALWKALGVTTQKDALSAVRGLQERVKYTETFESLLNTKLK